jgi:hypothetical protein
MDTAIQVVARGPLSGFLLRWLGAWTVATALSSLLLGLFYVLEERYRARPVIYVGIVGLLSLPALGGLLQGIVMRGLLQRATLWGALTGGGIVLAAGGVAVMLLSFHDLWLPLQYRLAVLAAERFGLASPPLDVVGLILTSALFGLILGAVQGVALVPRWMSVSAWLATSIVAGVLTGLWLYAWVAFEPVETLFAQSAEWVPLAGPWRYLPVSIVWAEVGALCFALPTGLLMQRLLRSYQRADDEALVRQFE